MQLYLDIETDFYQNITVIGFYSESTGFQQIVGRDITRARLSRRLPKPINSTDGESIGMGLRELYTFNGHCFDLPVIKKRLGLDLREKYDSKDLRFICKKHGLAGGQKIIEKMLGIRRELPDMDGRDALYLWQNYTEYGDEKSLSTLLAYNKEDVMNMVRIKEIVGKISKDIKPY
ncbi:MAG: ribonuclease H-like domain-containing protein [Candidatus Edwardsbacteria bacterium]|nr:ribonuclease H-like domain-containing protein [Candidatus Edwardsbacteria bacterium]MBU1577109.1 ribonuclease H-like domain-containing protein [Candidatus Edwardsbacteria bacterium]MBU2594041.1 ribonuclease H-like domain-containing protein [Candidatus Edwardsbacteria bacterium]